MNSRKRKVDTNLINPKPTMALDNNKMFLKVNIVKQYLHLVRDILLLKFTISRSYAILINTMPDSQNITVLLA